MNGLRGGLAWATNRLRTTGEETGATMVEYALMVALIAIVAFAAVAALGLDVLGIFVDPDLSDALT